MSSSSEHNGLLKDLGREGQPLLIAGPCGAESEEQVMDTATGLAATRLVDVFRCGIWKPRTRPGDFEGVGQKGLIWLQRIKKETGLEVMVEVAKPVHVELCLEHGIHIMWIGSRTIVNPFSVQDISDALEGTGASVMLKNPISPDLRLWIGALERLQQKGITKLAVVHRGFSVPDPGPYRNAPLWHLPLELKKAFPGIPVIGDPSHICGRRELLLGVSQHALDLGFDGLMIESHIHPQNALTDSEQQITPEEFRKLVKSLNKPVKSGADPILELLRQEIDLLDDELIGVLARRIALSERIGQYKKTHGMPALDQVRWQQVLRDRLQKGELAGLDRNFLEIILQEIHKDSIKRQ